jgi:hypothetical protein
MLWHAEHKLLPSWSERPGVCISDQEQNDLRLLKIQLYCAFPRRAVGSCIGMTHQHDLDGVLSLVEELCTAEQIRDLLRTKKGDENIRISAEDKEQLVRKNLRTAVESKAIEISKVFGLICDAEENGNQHVFYYRAPQRLAEILTFEHVARQIFGSSWEKTVAGFPSIRLKPDGYKISDFRNFTERKPKDWILKIYGEKTVLVASGKTNTEADGSVWRQYIPQNLRIVLSARWNSPDLLEIRVQRNESRRRVEEWFELVWSMLSPGMTREQFKAWDLKASMRNIALQAEDNTTIYDFRDVGVVDEANDIFGNFQAGSDEGILFKSELTRKAVKGFLEAGGELNALAVRWLARPTSEPREELRTLLGTKHLHEMVVAGHCLPGDLDYVTSQLRAFSKAKP